MHKFHNSYFVSFVFFFNFCIFVYFAYFILHVYKPTEGAYWTRGPTVLGGLLYSGARLPKLSSVSNPAREQTFGGNLTNGSGRNTSRRASLTHIDETPRAKLRANIRLSSTSDAATRIRREDYKRNMAPARERVTIGQQTRVRDLHV